MAAPVTLLDTSALAPREREDATRGFIETVTDLDVLGHACPPESIVTRVRTWDLRTLRLNVMDSPWLVSGLTHRTATEAVSIAAQVSGQTAKVHDGQPAGPPPARPPSRAVPALPRPAAGQLSAWGARRSTRCAVPLRGR